MLEVKKVELEENIVKARKARKAEWHRRRHNMKDNVQTKTYLKTTTTGRVAE